MAEQTQNTYENKVAVMVLTGTDQDLIEADAYLQRYPEAKIILVATVPEGEEPFEIYSRHLGEGNPTKEIKPNSTRNAPWLQYGDRISAVVLAEKDIKDRTASVDNVAQRVKDIISEKGWDLVGMLPNCHHAWNEKSVAKFAHAIGLEDYTTLDAIDLCNDKLAFSRMLKELPEIQPHMVVPRDTLCRKGDNRAEEANLIRQDIRDFVGDAEEWKVVLKPTWGGGSLGTRIISSDMDEDEIMRRINGHLRERAQMPLVGGPEISMLQEWVGDEEARIQEVGIHAVRKGSETLIDMTMKEMHEGKEASHFIPGNKDTELRREYNEYKDAIYPVIQQIYAEMGRRNMKLRHLNFDIRIWRDKATREVRFSVIDAQARSGLGHPEMMDWVYATEQGSGIVPAKAQELRMAMSLDVKEPPEREDPARIVEEYNRQTANYSATIDTLYPEGGIVHGNPLVLAAAVHSRAPGVFYANAPNLVKGDKISELLSINSSGQHMTIGSFGSTIMDAAERTNGFLQALGITIRPEGSTEKPKPIGIEKKAGELVPEVKPLNLDHAQITEDNCLEMTGIEWANMEKLAEQFRSKTLHYPTIVVPRTPSHPGGTVRFAKRETADNTALLIVGETIAAKGGNLELPPFLYRPQDGRIWGLRDSIGGTFSSTVKKAIRTQRAPRYNQGYTSINTRDIEYKHIVPYSIVKMTSQDRDPSTADPLGDSSIGSLSKKILWTLSRSPVQWCIQQSGFTYTRIAARMANAAAAVGYEGVTPSPKAIKAYKYGSVIPRDDLFIKLFGEALDIDRLAAKRRPPVAPAVMWKEFSDAIKRNRVWVEAAPGELSREWRPRVSTPDHFRRLQNRRFTLPWFFAQKSGLSNSKIAERIVESLYATQHNYQTPSHLAKKVSGWRRGCPVSRSLAPHLAKALCVSELAEENHMTESGMISAFCRIATTSKGPPRRGPVFRKRQGEPARHEQEADAVIGRRARRSKSNIKIKRITQRGPDAQHTLAEFFDIAHILYSNNGRLVVEKMNRLIELGGHDISPWTEETFHRVRTGSLKISWQETKLLEKATGLFAYFQDKDHLRRQFRQLVQGQQLSRLRPRATPMEARKHSQPRKGLPRLREDRLHYSAGPKKRGMLYATPMSGEPVEPISTKESEPFTLAWFFDKSTIGKEQRTVTAKTVAIKIADRMREMARKKARTAGGQPEIRFGHDLPSLVEGWIEGKPVDYQYLPYMPYLAYGLNVAEIAKSVKSRTGDLVTGEVLTDVLEKAAAGQSIDRDLIWSPTADKTHGRNGYGRG